MTCSAAMRRTGPFSAGLIMILLSIGRCSLSDWRVMEMAFATKETRPASMAWLLDGDRKSTRLNSSHGYISYAVFCLKKKTVTFEAQQHVELTLRRVCILL